MRRWFVLPLSTLVPNLSEMLRWDCDQTSSTATIVWPQGTTGRAGFSTEF
jgi:hypothetical protein